MEPTRAAVTRAPERDRDEVDFTWVAGLVERWNGPRLQRARAAVRWPDRGLLSVGGLLFAVVLGVWLTSGAWGARPPFGEDTMAHLARANFAIENLIPRGRVDGWDPTFILGYQEFLFIGPGFTWAVFGARVATFGLLSTTGAFKVVMIASFVALPLAVAFFARSLGLSSRSAALAAVLTLGVNNPFGGVGLQGLFNVGLVTHQFGAVFFFLALGGILRVLAEPSPKWIAFSAATGGALLMSHGISVILLGAVVAVVVPLARLALPTLESRKAERSRLLRQEVVAELRAQGLLKDVPATEPAEPSEAAPAPITSPGVRRLIVAGLGAVGLGAWTFLPFLAHRDLRGGFTGWANPPFGERLAQIWRGEILFRPGVVTLVLLGLLYGAYRVYEGRPGAVALAGAPIAFVAVSHAAFNLWPNVATFQLPNRGLGYAGVLAILPLAALIARVTRRGGVLGDLLALGAAGAIVVLPLGNHHDLARQMPEPIPQLREAANQLADRVPDGARFITERFFPQEIELTKVVNPDRWLAWASGRNTLNNFNVESSTTGAAAYHSEYIRERSPDETAENISRLGVTHLVTLSDVARDRISGSSRFRVVWMNLPLAIFEVLPKDGQPSPAALLTAPSPISARLVEGEPEHLTIDYSAEQGTRADIAIAWSPKWHARIDGRPQRLEKAQDGMLQITLPAGAHRLELDFRLDAWDYVGLVVTLATVAGGLYWLGLPWLRRRRQGTTGEDPDVTVPAPVPAAE